MATYLYHLGGVILGGKTGVQGEDSPSPFESVLHHDQNRKYAVPLSVSNQHTSTNENLLC